MATVAWILVVILAIAVAVLFLRRPEDPYTQALDRLARELERAEPLIPYHPGDPPDVTRLRTALAAAWAPKGGDDDEDPEARAMEGLVRYLREAATRPLRTALGEARHLPEVAASVVDALEDLEFYAASPPATGARPTDVNRLIQSVVRDYIKETEIPVVERFSAMGLSAYIDADGVSDALFMLLANAGRFGGGKTVIVEAEGTSEGVRIRVMDKGPGFSRDALEHAFRPFWTTDPDALGMGLTWARRRLEGAGLNLRVGNRPEGGGEAVIVLPSR
jgi:signal transduction histidine kinase